MPSTESQKVSKAGITTSTTGERHIPSSTRADGSVRKEIKIRPGYRPPEDVEVYRNRTAEAWKNRGRGGVPGAENIKSEDDPTKSAAANKNAKRREARKKAAATAAQTPKEGDQDKDTTGDQKANKQEEEVKKDPTPPISADSEANKEKEAKKLTKKLRQARELKDKKEKGDVLLPEQFEKVIKINELIRQLDSLGFDLNGEKKAET